MRLGPCLLFEGRTLQGTTISNLINQPKTDPASPAPKWSTFTPPLTRSACDVFDYIEMFYNPKRKHARNGMLSPVEFERQQKMKQEGV